MSPDMGSSLSIDYGTAFTTAAVSVGGRSELLGIGGSEADSKRLPSLVWVDEGGELVVGWAAEEGAAVAPERLERSPKQHLGEAPLELGRSVSAVEAAAAVFRRVSAEATRHLGGPPDQVFLTHPASWPNKRKAALRAAATEAGLARVELVPEPVAAARHLAGARLAPGATVAVYDLGGGTFDTAVLRREADGDFETLAVGGQDALGGEVFDARLARYVGQELARSDPEDWLAISRSPRALLSLRRSVRQGKEALSYSNAATVILPEAARRPSMRITRAELEHLLEGDVRRSVDILVETVAAAGVAPGELAAVYLVGGASRMPLVARLLAERFQRVPDTREDPKSVVVLGAARRSEPIEREPPEPQGASAPEALVAPSQGDKHHDSAGEKPPRRRWSPAPGQPRALRPLKRWRRPIWATAGIIAVLLVGWIVLGSTEEAKRAAAPARADLEATPTPVPERPELTKASVSAFLSTYAARYSEGDTSGLEELLAGTFTSRFAADRTRTRSQELNYYRQEAARKTRLTLRVASVRLFEGGAEAVTRWTKKARSGGFVLEPGTPTQEPGGLTSEFRGQSRFRLDFKRDELTVRRVLTTYDLRLPVCAAPSTCAKTPGAQGTVEVASSINTGDGELPVTRTDTFTIPRPKMRILYIPLNADGRREMTCDRKISVRKRYRILGVELNRRSLFRWCSQ